MLSVLYTLYGIDYIIRTWCILDILPYIAYIIFGLFSMDTFTCIFYYILVTYKTLSKWGTQQSLWYTQAKEHMFKIFVVQYTEGPFPYIGTLVYIVGYVIYNFPLLCACEKLKVLMAFVCRGDGLLHMILWRSIKEIKFCNVMLNEFTWLMHK